MLSIIVALAKQNRAIGKNNGLLWKIPEDLHHFKEVTFGHPIIMGRKTYESIGRPLPGRTNIVITRDPAWKQEKVKVVSDIQTAIDTAQNEEHQEVFIIGGGQIYKQTIELVDKLYITEVEGDYSDATVFFPPYEKLFHLISEKKLQTETAGTLTFQLWEKNLRVDSKLSS